MDSSLLAEVGSPRRTSRLAGYALLVVAAAYVIWLLSLPAFPTQDGPIHLYYTRVLGALLGSRPGVYPRFYTIKHRLPPYALYYYALLALSHRVPLLLADRLVLCGYVLLFLSGFRFLARALGPWANEATLLASLLLLNWPLGMGFVNFCLSLSLGFWALGVWLRARGRAGVALRLAFVALAVAMMLTHPVPLLGVLAVAGGDLLLPAVMSLRRPTTGTDSAADGVPVLARPAGLWADLVTLLAAASTLAYVRLFTNAHPLAQVAPGPSRTFVAQVAANVVQYGAERGLVFLNGPGAELRLTRAVVYLSLLPPLGLALRAWLRRRRSDAPGGAAAPATSQNPAFGSWRPPQIASPPAFFWSGLFLVAAVLLPFVPHDLNASHFFADRLLLPVWLLGILAGAQAGRPSPRARLVLVGGVLLAQGVLLHAADRHLRPVARAVAALEATPNTPGVYPCSVPPPIAFPPDLCPPLRANPLGLVLNGAGAPAEAAPTGLAFNPGLWAPVHYLRHNGLVLANTPWLDLAIIPLGATPALPTADLSPAALEEPSLLREELAADPATRARVFGAVGFLVLGGTPGAAPNRVAGRDPLLRMLPDGDAWRCGNGPVAWLRLCEAPRRELRGDR